MTAILTSSLGGSHKINGKRIPTYLLNKNGLTDQIKKYWQKGSNVLIISASPGEYDRNDNILFCQKEAFSMSGLSVGSFGMCDYRNEEIIKNIHAYNVLLLAGGHVPTQNEFLKKLDLKSQLRDYKGIIISWSAGSMNCAEIVYAQPELEGEAVDTDYRRFISGLGITKKMIIPHFQDVKKDVVDGLRMMEDITYPDSKGREFIALNDGSYIISDDGTETLYGEAYRIKDGKIMKICSEEHSVIL